MDLIFAGIAALVYNALYQRAIPQTPFIDLILTAGVLLVLSLIGMAILGARNFRRTFNQLDELVDASGKVAEGDYSVRVEERGPRGIRSLIRALTPWQGSCKRMTGKGGTCWQTCHVSSARPSR